MVPFHFFYQILLRIFPRGFYADFHEEMQSVFAEVMEEAASRGRIAFVASALKELVCLPGEALRLHLASGSVKLPGARAAGWEGPPTRKETWLAVAAFTIPVLGFLYRDSIVLSTRLPFYLVAGLVLGVLLAGFLKGFPRWSLPYLGLVLSTACFFLLVETKADQLFPLVLKRMGILAQNESVFLVFEAAWSGLLWLSLFSMTVLVIGLLSLLNRCHTMLQRIRQDWTLASYILYAGMLAALGLSFSRHLARQNIFAVGSLFCLGVGAWLFLRSPRLWQRSLALLGGLTLAAFLAFTGESPLHPLQLDIAPSSQAVVAILEWGWMAVLLLAPVILRFLPRYPGQGET